MASLAWKEVAKDPSGFSLQALWLRHYLNIACDKDSIQEAQQDLKDRMEKHPRKNYTQMWHSYGSEIKDGKVEVYKLFPGSRDKAPKLIYLIEVVSEVRSKKDEVRKEVAHG